MPISIKAKPNQFERYFDIDFEDLGLSEDQWNELSEDEKEVKVFDYLNESESYRLYWEVLGITEE